MTLRCPNDIENYDGNRLAECPKSNKILIISETCKTREDLDRSYHLFGLHTAISMLTSSYYQAKFFANTIKNNDIKNTFNSPEDALGDMKVIEKIWKKYLGL